jgi:hypothetical protein
MMVLKIGVTVVGLAVGFYFGFGWVTGMQEKTNAKRRQIEKQSDGGEAVHIANLYDVLDKTDPNRYSRGTAQPSDSETMPRVRLRTKNTNAAGGVESEEQPAEKELPVIPATWTLDLNAAQIPEGRANGNISGTNFIVDSARVDVVGGAYVLSLRQGPITAPDRQMLVYLRLKAGETLPSHTWSVTKEMKGTGVPQVAKLWKTDPRYASMKKNFATGYAMKLEFGAVDEYGVIPGKIFIALPDAEQSVVAGLFKVETALPDFGYTPATARPGQSKPPVAGQVTPEERAGVAY